MTKQFIKFEDLKKEILLEASKTRYPAGMFWNFHPDPKDDKNNHRGVIDFYYAVDNNQNKDGKHEEAIKTYIKNTLKVEKPNDITFDYSGVESPTEITSQKFNKDYTLKRIRMPFGINPTSDAKAIKEKLQKYFKEKLREFTENAKLYTSCELRDTSGEFYKNQKDDTEAAVNLIDDMIHNPNKFSGYKTLEQRLQEIKNMSTGEFVHQYASQGPIQAFIAKKIFDLINDRRAAKKKEKEEKGKKPERSSPGFKEELMDQDKNLYSNKDQQRINFPCKLTQANRTREIKIDDYIIHNEMGYLIKPENVENPNLGTVDFDKNTNTIKFTADQSVQPTNDRQTAKFKLNLFYNNVPSGFAFITISIDPKKK